jgi:hypothetical protein
MDYVFFIFCVLDVYRWVQFVLITVENEYINNPEKYRKYIPVPELEK